MLSLQRPLIRTRSGAVHPFAFVARATGAPHVPMHLTVARPAPRGHVVPSVSHVPRYLRRPGVGATRRGPHKKITKKMPLRIRGLGQTTTASAPSVGLPSCGTDTATNTGQIILGVGGGLAMVVGIIGAVVSDQYREEFAITAGVGLLASFAGAAWAMGSAASCVAGTAQSSIASLTAPSAPSPIPAPPGASISGAVQLPYAVPTNQAVSSTF